MIQRRISKINSKLIVASVISVLSSCSTEKSTEYWLKPDNQDGILVNFFTSDEYCIEAIRTSIEFKEINKIDSITSEKVFNSIIDSLQVSPEIFQIIKSLAEINSKAYYELALLKENLVEASGGYCAPDSWDYTKEFPLFPILPYQTKSNSKFWNESENRNRLIEIIQAFQLKIDSVTKKHKQHEDFSVLKSAFPTVSTYDQAIDKFLMNNSTIGAILNLKKIQLAAVEKRIRLQKAILEVTEN